MTVMARNPYLKLAKAPGHFIRDWRMARGWTIEELAGRVDWTPATVSRIETGERGYTQRSLEALAVAFGCDPADLLRSPPDQRELKAFDLLRRLSGPVYEAALAMLNGLLAGQDQRSPSGASDNDMHPDK